MISCGINLEHDAGCCIIQDGEILQATLAERLDRRKYSNNWQISFEQVMHDLGLKITDIDVIVLSTGGGEVSESYGMFMDYACRCYSRLPQHIITVDHHVSHAYSASMVSPFMASATMVIDGGGNRGERGKSKETFFKFNGMTLTLLHENRNMARGIGKTYDAFTRIFGWSQMDAGKTMGLASYGLPDRLSGVRLFTVNGFDVVYHLNDVVVDEGIERKLKARLASQVDRDAIGRVIQFLRNHGVDFAYGEPPDSALSKDIAHFLQRETERAIIALTQHLYDVTRDENLCFAGGVALNCIANKKILDETLFQRLFVCPAASDKGQCLGNALYGYYVTLKGDKRIEWAGDFLGREYPNSRNESALASCPFVSWRYCSDEGLIDETVELILGKKIVGWFQGKSELGPRALGNRSILCDPRDPKMKDILNRRVKHREPFRPFAASILEDSVRDYFYMDCNSHSMTLAVRANENAQKLLPAIVHVDNTSRVQTISPEWTPVFYKLVQRFGEVAGVPAVLNTSFNDSGEPLVETPEDALKCFLNTDIDCLVIHNILIQKNIFHALVYRPFTRLRRHIWNFLRKCKRAFVIMPRMLIYSW